MTGRRKKDHHLPTRVYDIDGRHVYVDRTGKWHELGKEWNREAKDKWLKLSEGQAPSGTVAKLLDDFLLWCEGEVRAGRRSKRTLEDNESEAVMLKKVFGRMQPHTINSKHIASYLVKRTDNRKGHEGEPAPVRANREMAMLSSAYSWAMGRDDWPLVQSNPCYGVRRNKEAPRTVVPDTLNLVRFGKFTMPWLRGYCVLKRLTGLRQGDMLRLNRRSIGAIRLHARANKTGGDQIKFRRTWALDIVLKWILEHQPCKVESIALFPSEDGGAYAESGFKTTWNREMHRWVEAGGEWIVENDIRAKMVSDSGTIEEAQARAGHRSSATTRRVYRRRPMKVDPLR